MHARDSARFGPRPPASEHVERAAEANLDGGVVARSQRVDAKLAPGMLAWTSSRRVPITPPGAEPDLRASSSSQRRSGKHAEPTLEELPVDGEPRAAPERPFPVTGGSAPIASTTSATFG